MTDFEIRFWLCAAMCGYAYVTTRWGYKWRDWFLWAEYVVGAVFIVGATSAMYRAGIIRSIEDYQTQLIINYGIGGAPVILGQVIHAIYEADEARKRRAEGERDVQTT